MNALVAAPLLTALGAGTLCLLAGPRAQRSLLGAGALAHLLAALATSALVLSEGPHALHIGGWNAPLGIALVADSFAVVFLSLSGLLGFAIALQARRRLAPREVQAGFPALLFFLLAGVDAAFLTADLFHLYVAFEVLLLASFVQLVVGGGEERRSAAVRYLIPGVLSSMLLLAGVGLLYGLTGTLSMPAAAERVAELGSTPAVRAVAGLLALAFALKAALFPVFAWLPAAYPAARSEVAALFSGLLTKVGVYALVRVFTLVLPAELAWLGPVLLLLAALTMVCGVLGALAQWDMQRLLSFHVVSQVGYLVLGLGLGTTAALAATVYYVFHNSVAKCGLLLATGLVRAERGTDRLRELGGLVRSAPALSALFLLCALALAGVPPLSGFWAKLLVLRAALGVQAWAVVAVAAGVGLLTLLSMAKIWVHAFWGEPASAPEQSSAGPRAALELAPLALLGAVVVALGVGAGPAIDASWRAAEGLLDPSGYLGALREAAQ